MDAIYVASIQCIPWHNRAGTGEKVLNYLHFWSAQAWLAHSKEGETIQ